MSNDKDRYWPRSFSLEPLERDPVTILNEPPLPDNVTLMPIRQRSLHAATNCPQRNLDVCHWPIRRLDAPNISRWDIGD